MPNTAPRGGRDTVVFVSVSRGMGGPARSLLTVLRHLDPAVRRILFAPSGSLASEAANEGLIADHINMPHRDVDRRRSRVDAATALARAIRADRDRIQALHANGETELNLTAMASLFSGVPVVMWAHTSRPSPTSGWLAPLWRRRSPVRWLAVSDIAGDVLADTLRIPRGNVGIVPNPIDPADVVGTPVPHEGVRVGYLGLAVPHKGFDLLAPMMEALDRTDVSLDLFVAPPPANLPLELRPAWDALAALEGRRPVYMAGRTNDVRRAYAELDIVVCPSRQESFGRVAAEAMLNGLPVVASDLPAYRELLGDDQAGLLFPVGDAEAAAAAVSRLADDAELRRRLGEAGRARAQGFSPEKVVPLLAAEYRRAAGR
jgi:glycosyltransferase involved in cell wall biosynthesis